MEVNSTKLQCLCHLVSTRTVIPYNELLNKLDFSTKQELEDFVIATVQNGYVEARLDPLNEELEVTDYKDASTPETELASMESILQSWEEYTIGFIRDLQSIVVQSDEALKERNEKDKKIACDVSENGHGTAGPKDPKMARR